MISRSLIASRPSRAWAAAVWVALAVSGCGGGGGGGEGGNAQNAAALMPDVVALALDATAVSGRSAEVNLVAQGFVPMNVGDTWAYDVMENGVTTTGKVTREVVGGPDGEGRFVLRETDDGEEGIERHIRLADGIHEEDPFGAADLFPAVQRDLPSWLTFPNALIKRDVERHVVRSGSLEEDLDGDGKHESYGLSLVQRFKGFKVVDVVGSPTEVAHVVFTYVFEIRYSKDKSTYKITAVQSNAYAASLGMVQSERIFVQDGAEILRQRLLLRAARVGGVDHAVGTARTDKSTLLQITPSSEGGFNPGDDHYKGVLKVTLAAPGDFVQAVSTTTGIASVATEVADAGQATINIQFKLAHDTGPGTFNDVVTVTVCKDRACRLPVAGSPIAVPVTVVAGRTQRPEPGVTPLKPLRQQALTHDVVAVRYSRGLDRVVMASSQPDNRLYVMDPSSGAAQSVPLSRAPTSLSLSPDGKKAAVGHDGRVTWIDLTTVWQPSVTMKQLGLSAKASSLVLDAAGHVFVVPANEQWAEIHAIDVATNTERLTATAGRGVLYGDDSIVLRPDGLALYTQFAHLSGAGLHAWSVQAGLPLYQGESDPTAFGDELCPGRLFLSNDGARLVTVCGLMVNAKPGTAQDMLYHSSIPLSPPPVGSSAFRLVDLDQGPGHGQWAAIEYTWQSCSGARELGWHCFYHLNVYDDDSFVLRERWALGPVAIAGSAYDQDGVATFHSANGQHLYLITRLVRMSNPAASYLFQVIR